MKKLAMLYKKITDSSIYGFCKIAVILVTMTYSILTNPIGWLEDQHSVANQTDMILEVQDAEQEERERRAEEAIRAKNYIVRVSGKK